MTTTTQSPVIPVESSKPIVEEPIVESPPKRKRGRPIKQTPQRQELDRIKAAQTPEDIMELEKQYSSKRDIADKLGFHHQYIKIVLKDSPLFKRQYFDIQCSRCDKFKAPQRHWKFSVIKDYFTKVKKAFCSKSCYNEYLREMRLKTIGNGNKTKTLPNGATINQSWGTLRNVLYDAKKKGFIQKEEEQLLPFLYFANRPMWHRTSVVVWCAYKRFLSMFGDVSKEKTEDFVVSVSHILQVTAKYIKRCLSEGRNLEEKHKERTGQEYKITTKLGDLLKFKMGREEFLREQKHRGNPISVWDFLSVLEERQKDFYENLAAAPLKL